MNRVWVLHACSMGGRSVIGNVTRASLTKSHVARESSKSSVVDYCDFSVLPGVAFPWSRDSIFAAARQIDPYRFRNEAADQLGASAACSFSVWA